MLETDDNYRRRFVACPRENEHACPFLNVIDPDYPKQARDVIDELAAELREVRDAVRLERNEHHIIQDEDKAVDAKVRVELRKWKVRCCVSALLNLVLVCCGLYGSAERHG